MLPIELREVRREELPVRYRLLGPVAVQGEHGPVRLAGPKQRSVLAALLLHANHVVAEDRLFDLVWGQDPPPSVRGRLQVHIWELRKALGRDVISRPSAGYLVEVGPGELDLHEFTGAVAAARTDFAAGGAAAAARRLRAALALWTGPALDGVSAPLAEREAPTLEERRLSALEELFEAELAAGRHAEVVGELRGVAGEHPFRERLQAQLMLALHRCGRSPEALRVYLETYNRLESELGIQPGQSLQDLQVRILNGEDEEPAGPRPEITVPAPVRPAELPPDVPGFTGRDTELARLHDQVAPAGPAGGIWVISGTAGVGKTALAVHWAHTVRDRFPDGQLHLDLRGFRAGQAPLAPADGLAQLLRSLGVDHGELPVDLGGRVRLYRSLLADRRVLVLLDDAADAEQVLPLLPSAGTVVVTSRYRLGELVARTGAHPLPLAPLSESDATGLLAGLLGADRVAAEPDAAAELARLCGRLPLAMRLAAANLNTGPNGRIADLADQLGKGDPLAELTVDGAEESVLTSAFALSYRALPPRARRLFRLLGLVPGAGFTPEAAAVLADIPPREAGRLLTVLTAASLVEEYGPRRYRFHALVRFYAADRARAEEGDEDRERAWARLLEFSLASTDACAPLRAGHDRHDQRHTARPQRSA